MDFHLPVDSVQHRCFPAVAAFPLGLPPKHQLHPHVAATQTAGVRPLCAQPTHEKVKRVKHSVFVSGLQLQSIDCIHTSLQLKPQVCASCCSAYTREGQEGKAFCVCIRLATPKHRLNPHIAAAQIARVRLLLLSLHTTRSRGRSFLNFTKARHSEKCLRRLRLKMKVCALFLLSL